MSLPRQTSSYSSSPSKSSLRTASGTPNPSTRTLLPSPHFEDTLPQSSSRSPQERPIQYGVPVEEESAQPGPPALQPFFTLIEDSATNEHHHPTVHYIFADDDADIITEAAFRSVENDRNNDSERSTQQTHKEHDDEDIKLPPLDPNIREHYVILDVHPDAAGTSYEVANAQSLSSEWQVLRTSITKAPSFDAETADTEDALMLKIDGRGNTPPDAEDGKRRSDAQSESMEEMVEKFQKRLDDIKRTMEAGGQFGNRPPEGSHEHLQE